MRELYKYEEEFIQFLLNKTNNKIYIPKTVIVMKDGDMGSISFDLNSTESRFDQIAGGDFIDEDGKLVDFELTVNSKGELFELDFWKVDFRPLASYPKANMIRLRTTKTISSR